MKKMKGLLSGVLILIMAAALLQGCSSTDTAKEKKEDAPGSSGSVTVVPGEKTTLKVQLIGDFKQEDSTDPVSGETRKGVAYLEEEFEKQNQNIDLQFIIMGWDDYQKKTQSMMLAGEADVYQAPGIGALAEQDLLEPLQPYNDKDKFDLSVYIDGQVDGWKVVGVKDSETQIYGLPMIADTRFIVYDKQIFDNWGVPYLSSEPTLEEIIDAAKKMTGINPVSGEQNYGITFSGKDAGDTLMNINEY